MIELILLYVKLSSVSYIMSYNKYVDNINFSKKLSFCYKIMLFNIIYVLKFILDFFVK